MKSFEGLRERMRKFCIVVVFQDTTNNELEIWAVVRKSANKSRIKVKRRTLVMMAPAGIFGRSGRD